MKKFGKFLLGTLSLAAAAGGVYCLYKNRIARDADFDNPDDEDFDSDVAADSENREYVSITISGEKSEAEADAAEAGTDSVSEDTVSEATASDEASEE